MQPQYDHIQKSSLYLIIFATGVLQLIAATTFSPWSISIFPGIILFLSGIFVIFLAFGFQHLQTVDQGNYLTIGFGKLPLPLCKRKLFYKTIIKVEIGRTLLLDGWGIHYSISGGWVWNIWGRDCVVVYCDKETLRIGTDDAAKLRTFLQTKIV
ncbi:MAG: hypothetical protein ACOYNM_02740 [Gemmataceae bacterium]